MVTVDLLIILIGTAMPSSCLNATSVHDAQHPIPTNVSCTQIVQCIAVYIYYLYTVHTLSEWNQLQLLCFCMS